MDTVRILVSGLLLVITIPYLFLFAFQKVFVYTGWYLRRKTLPRRSYLLDNLHQSGSQAQAGRDFERIASHDELFEEQARSSSSSSSLEQQPKSNWNGVIGFFHPFW